MGFSWDDVTSLLREPLFIEAVLAVVLFVAALLVFRKMRRVAEELERRKALGEYVRGLDEFLRDDYRQAIGTLEKVLERDPENVEARIALGDCYREVGDAAEAKKHHHHVHKVFGHELARNFLSLGEDELALGNFDAAVEAFERALALAPGDTAARAGLARAFAEGGNPVAAAEQLRVLYPRGPGEEMSKAARREAARRFTDAGIAVLEEGNAEGGIRFFTEALAFQPESIRARTALVRAAHGLDDPERARRIVEEHVAVLRELADEEEVLFEPSAAASAAPPAAEPAPPGGSLLPAKTESLGALVAAVEEKTARFACAECGTLLRDHTAQCPSCGAVGTVESLPGLASLYTMPLPGFREAVDEVEETAAFVQTLARRAATGDEEALGRLLERGPAALYDVFAALPSIEKRRYLGARLAALGAAASREVRECHHARPDADFAAAFFLALGDADSELRALGPAHDRAVAGVMADRSLDDGIRDRALARLETRGAAVLPAVVDAVAASGDAGAVERAARLARVWGGEALALLERRYLQATLLGKLFGARGARRRTAADILARAGLPGAADALGRAAAREKDAAIRAHYVAARERAEQG